MTARLVEAWSELRLPHTKPVGGYRLALLYSDSSVRAFAAIEASSGRCGVLIDVPTSTPDVATCTLLCKTFEVITASFPGMAPYRIGILTLLRDMEYQDLFGILAQEMLAAIRLAGDGGEAVAAIKRVVERWRYFTEKWRGPMPEIRVRGLIGELVVLARLVRSGDPNTALEAWTGPTDGLHDFELQSWSGEVKTFLAEEGPTVRVSDPRQLEVVQSRPVYLIPVKLARTKVSGKSLASIIEIVKQHLLDSPGASDVLELKLADYGYLSAHSHLYTEPYACERVNAFAVRDGFPRISSDDVPPGITNIQYSLNLGSLSAFAVEADSLLGAPTAGLEGVAP